MDRVADKAVIVAADLFAGAGGTSTGMIEACDDLGYECELTAINHWDIAVATHTANHPKARHLCASLDALNPLEKIAVIPDGSVQCCVTSPPYWGLRDYGTASWVGGAEGCNHAAPVAGSGTTGMVALELGRRAVLIELNPEYCELIRNRCDVTPGLPI